MLELLQEIIRRYTDDEKMVITSETVLLADLGLNSYELVELICEVEEKFAMEIPDRAIHGFKTVQHLLDYIVAHE